MSSTANQSELDQSALENLDSIEEEIEASSIYFKPKPEKIVPVENEGFKDAYGNPVRHYECRITHTNNSKEQKWTVSKTVCLLIIEQLKRDSRC